MGFDEARFGGAVVVKPDQRIDLTNADPFRDALTGGLASAKLAVVVDMSGVDYISSAGLRALMIANRAAKASGKAFSVAGLTPLVLEIFTISRFNLVITAFGSVRDAIAASAPDGLAQFDPA
jgi:anti-anti-sigma factor